MTTIYQFTKYDIRSDTACKSRRWGTREGIEGVDGTVLEDTATEVDDSALSSEIRGLTAIGFDPRPSAGFQRELKSEMRSP